MHGLNVKSQNQVPFSPTVAAALPSYSSKVNLEKMEDFKHGYHCIPYLPLLIPPHKKLLSQKRRQCYAFSLLGGRINRGNTV